MTAFERFRAAFQPAMQVRLDVHVARLSWSAVQVREHQRTQLRALLAHAIERSPFHRRRLADIDPSTFELDELVRLPVMTKTDMMASFDDVVTDRRLTLEVAERALAATNTEPVPFHDRFIALASGGSAGRRGVYVMDYEELVEFFATLSRGLTARIRAMGGAPPGGVPIAMVAAASAVHATGVAESLTNIDGLPFRFLPVPVTLPLDEMMRRLEALNTPFLYGYPSMLARLAGEKRAGRLAIAPRMISTTSETLTPELRAAITGAFDVPIVDTFGSTECLVGATPPNELVHTFASDTCIVELVDRDGNPVPDGVASDRILVTNLSNRTQPLIRYEMNDSFTRQPPSAEHGHLRATVHGRTDDVLSFGSVQVHPHVIRSVMLGVPAVLDYQIRQTKTGVELVAVADGAQVVDVDRVRRGVARGLVAAGLREPTVSVHLVPALERDAHTGKVKRVVPL